MRPQDPPSSQVPTISPVDADAWRGLGGGIGTKTVDGGRLAALVVVGAVALGVDTRVSEGRLADGKADVDGAAVSLGAGGWLVYREAST